MGDLKLSKKFNKNDIYKLDDPNRVNLLPPYKVLSMFGLENGVTTADIGAGTGYFSLPISEIIGDKNILYAIDTELDMIEVIDKKIKQNGIRNIRTVVSEENALKIDDKSVDFTFVAFVLHEVLNIQRFIDELKRITSDNGKIAIIEWKNIESDFGPPIDQRLDKEIIKKEFADRGIKLFEEINISDEIIGLQFMLN